LSTKNNPENSLEAFHNELAGIRKEVTTENKMLQTWTALLG
jgi:hypothetical protein